MRGHEQFADRYFFIFLQPDIVSVETTYRNRQHPIGVVYIADAGNIGLCYFISLLSGSRINDIDISGLMGRYDILSIAGKNRRMTPLPLPLPHWQAAAVLFCVSIRLLERQIEGNKTGWDRRIQHTADQH